MAAWTAAARHVANMARLPSPKSASTASIVHRRGLIGPAGADHHGPPKVNFFDDLLSPSKWKQHIVLVSLTGSALLLYGGYKFFTEDKKDNKEERVGGAPG